MKRSLVTTTFDHGKRPLSPVELEAVHGGELKLEVPAYVPLSQSHPKTEVVLPRVRYSS